jgi:hypothetical protein
MLAYPGARPGVIYGGGSQTSKQKYSAYGTIRTTVGTVPTPYEFTGQRLS